MAKIWILTVMCTASPMSSCPTNPAWTDLPFREERACLEAGAGGGSITEWLCKRVGDQGRVLATDIDTRFVGELSYPNLDVQRHDITTDDVPESEFDLVHARLLLEHLPGHALALSKLVAALKPGAGSWWRISTTLPVGWRIPLGIQSDRGSIRRRGPLVSSTWMPTESDWTLVVGCTRCVEIRGWPTLKLKAACSCPLEVRPLVRFCTWA